MTSPSFDDDLRLLQRVEDLPVEQLGIMEQAHHEEGWFESSIAASMGRMEDDLIVKALRDKQAEIHERITAYQAQIEQAKHDLAHVNATLRLFTDVEKERARYVASHGFFRKGEIALRHDLITAPCVIDGPINGESLHAYIEQMLQPSLKPGDIVILNNPVSHKSHETCAAICSVSARLLFLPPYSLDLNPIEQVFAKMKTLLCKAEERTVEAAWRCIGALLDRFTPAECINSFRNSGYGST